MITALIYTNMNKQQIINKWCDISKYPKEEVLAIGKILEKAILDKMLEQIFEYENLDFYGTYEDLENFIHVDIKNLENEVHLYIKQKNEISKVMSHIGKQSGKNMTPEQRKERAKKAIQTRWDKKRQSEQHTIKVINN